MSELVLASASPRRRELLARAGVAFRVAPADLDEEALPDEAPANYAERVAHDKARAVADRHPGAWVLAADTVVIVDGDSLGKPADEADARVMLRRLAGRSHVVVTGVCLIHPGEGALRAAERLRAATEVTFRTLSEEEIEAYVASGEWRGKAGGYAAQGIAAALITEIRGSYTNVVGLPLAETLDALRRAGGPVPDLARGAPA